MGLLRQDTCPVNAAVACGRRSSETRAATSAGAGPVGWPASRRCCHACSYHCRACTHCGNVAHKPERPSDRCESKSQMTLLPGAEGECQVRSPHAGWRLSRWSAAVHDRPLMVSASAEEGWSRSRPTTSCWRCSRAAIADAGTVPGAGVTGNAQPRAFQDGVKSEGHSLATAEVRPACCCCCSKATMSAHENGYHEPPLGGGGMILTEAAVVASSRGL